MQCSSLVAYFRERSSNFPSRIDWCTVNNSLLPLQLAAHRRELVIVAADWLRSGQQWKVCSIALGPQAQNHTFSIRPKRQVTGDFTKLKWFE